MKQTPPTYASAAARVVSRRESTAIAISCSDRRRRVFGKGTPDPRPAEELTKVAAVSPAPEAPAPEMALTDPRILKALGSLRRAAWFIVVFTALTFLTTLFR